MTDELLKSIATGGPIAVLFALFLLVMARWILPIVQRFISATERITDVAEQCVRALQANSSIMERLEILFRQGTHGAPPANVDTTRSARN